MLLEHSAEDTMADYEHDEGRPANAGRPHHDPVQQLITDVAVLTSEFRNYKRDADKSLERITVEIKEANNRYVSHDEYSELKREVRELKQSISWAVKIVLFVVIVAILSLVVSKTGLPVAH